MTRTPARPSGPRSGPRNLAFADGLDGWTIGGSSRAEVTGAHWNDYAVAAADGAATLSAAVPQPYGDVFLGQEWLTDDYRGATVTLRAEVRSQDVGGHAELSLDIVSQAEGHNQDQVMHAPPGDQPQPGPARAPGPAAPQRGHHRDARLDQLPDHWAGPRRRRAHRVRAHPRRPGQRLVAQRGTSPHQLTEASYESATSSMPEHSNRPAPPC